jgi:hypothetical protein
LAAGTQPDFFADLARLGLGDGRITPRMVTGLLRALVRP